ncbi:hypothetical protein PISMIDRAFT_108064, partial [Pisolithus microcarpus 441]
VCGILKNHFKILLLGHQYSLNIQRCIPVALCTIHNFIQIHESDMIIDEEENSMDKGEEYFLQHDGDEEGDVEYCDRIAESMWEDYLNI